MKKLLVFTLLSLASFIGYSQNGNGGQFFENNAIRLFYLGRTNGTHTFKVVNKQNCSVVMKTRVDQEDPIDMETEAKDSFYVNVPRTAPENVKFRVKTETSCDLNISVDKGWLEVNTSFVSLDLVESNFVRIIREGSTYNISLKGNVLRSDFGMLSEYQTVIIHDISGNKIYQNRSYVRKINQLDLNQYMKPGLNLVSVLIENKKYDHFTFKSVK